MAGKLTLRPCRIPVFKESGSYQATAVGAAVEVFRQGATCRTGTTVTPAGVAVTVFNRGRLAVNDTVQLGVDDTAYGLVTAVTDSTVTVQSQTGGNWDIDVGERLLPTNDQPTIYSDEIGVTSIANSTKTVDAAGEALFYCPETLFDYVVSGSGLTSQLVTDSPGGWVRGGSTWINAKDYPTIQAAVDAVPSTGGTVYIPAGTYTASTVPAFAGVTLSTAGTVLQGEGWGNTILSTTSTTAHLVSIDASACRVVDLSLQGPNSAGTGYGIYVNPSGADPLYYTTIERISTDGTASYALYIKAVCVMVKVANCVFADSKAGGSVYSSNEGNGGSTMLEFDGCLFAGPSYGANGNLTKGVVHVEGGATHTFKGCGFQTPNASDDTYLSLGNFTYNVGLYNCYFEKAVTTPTKYMITTTGNVFNLALDNLYVRHTKDDGSTDGLGGEPLLLRSDTATALIGLWVRGLHLGTNGASSTGDVYFGAAYDTGLDGGVLVSNIHTGVWRKLAVAGTTDNWSVFSTNQGDLPAGAASAPALRIPTHTTAQLAAMVGVLEGALAFDTTLDKLQVYISGSGWTSVH